MYIAIDFDGTVCRHRYPEIGEDIGAVPVLRELIAAGHKLILFTMRSGETLEDAVAWFEVRRIPLFGINVNPTQSSWSESPKAYAHLYIDDAALGTPLLRPENERPFVDWVRVYEYLYKTGVLNDSRKFDTTF